MGSLEGGRTDSAARAGTSGPSPRILLIGLGDLGSMVLEFLAREPHAGPIVAAGRDAARGERRVNLARLGAIAQGYTPSIRFSRVDLDRPGDLAELVAREKPDVILSTAVRQTWWLTDLLPPEQAARLHKAGFGVWLPIQLELSLTLMSALRAADYRGITLTTPFPDVVNAMLAKIGLAPTCGVGNVDEIAAKVRWMAATRLGEPVGNISVQLVAHHALEHSIFEGTDGPLPPYHLRVYAGDRDVTASAGPEWLLRTPYPIAGGPATNFMTAGSIVRFIRALGCDQSSLLHAPAPGGLPGGYPIEVRAGEVRVSGLKVLSVNEAIAINEASHRFDGIDHIEPDGTAVFCPEDAEVLRRELGYDAETLRPYDAKDRAAELMAKLREFALKSGVDLDRAWQAARLSG